MICRVLVFPWIQGPWDLCASQLSPTLEKKTMHNLNQESVITCTIFFHLPIFYLLVSPQGNTCVNKPVCSNVSVHSAPGSQEVALELIPCWWLKAVDNRNACKGDQSRLAQDTAEGMLELFVISKDCYLGSGMLRGGTHGQTLTLSTNANAQLKLMNLWLHAAIYLREFQRGDYLVTQTGILFLQQACKVLAKEKTGSLKS